MGKTYWVIAQDGQAYGPADESTLAQWAGQGRLTALSSLQDAATNERLTAGQVPALATCFGLTTAGPARVPQQAAGMQQPQMQYPQAIAPQPGYAGQPAYQQPAAYQQQQTAIPQAMAWNMGASGATPTVRQPTNAQSPQAALSYNTPFVPSGQVLHQLTTFSTAGVVLLHYLTFGIFTFFHFQLMHGRLPVRRPDDPSAGKAIGFMFIPFFNLYWFFFSWTRLMTRIDDERMAAGLPPAAPRTLFLVAAIMQFIPLLNYIAFLILMPVFAGVMRSYVNQTVQATRGPTA